MKDIEKSEEFKGNIKKCRRVSVDVIIVKSISSFSRNAMDILACVENLK